MTPPPLKPPPPPKPLPSISKQQWDAQPPHSQDAEQGVIGSCILDPHALDTVSLIVQPSDFYMDAHITIYQHLINMHQEGCRIDITLLVDRLKNNGQLDQVGGLWYIGSLVTGVAHAAHADEYARIVAEKSALRAVMTVTAQAYGKAIAYRASGEKVLNELEESVHTLREKRSASNESVHRLDNVLAEAMQTITKRRKGEAEQPLATGLADLDSVLRIHRKNLIVLAARPSMGKSALAVNIAQHAATQGAVLFVSLEMSKTEIADRMVAAWSQIMLGRIIAGTLGDWEMNKVMDVCGSMAHMPLHIDDTPGRSVMQIASMARRIKRTEKGLALIVIDYIQLIEPSDPRDPRQEQVSKISRRLKVLARELNVPILVLAQLNRQAEASSDNRPKLSHLRESGAIEQDADVVLFVHRPEYYCNTDEDRKGLEGKAYIIVAKQRNGMAGVDVECLWQRDFQRFVSVAKHLPSHDFGDNEVVRQDSDPFDFPGAKA